MSRNKGGSQTALVAAVCWQNTQLASYLKPLIPLSYRGDLGEADFLPSKDAAVIFLHEAEIASGGGFRRRVVKFRQSSSITTERRIVVVQNTTFTEQNFTDLQKFINIDLGLPVIPVQSLKETAHLLARMVASETKIKSNLFRDRRQHTESQNQQLVHSLTTAVPSLTSLQAWALLAHFGTMQALAMAPRDAMKKVVDKAAAAAVQEFFSGRAE